MNFNKLVGHSSFNFSKSIYTWGKNTGSLGHKLPKHVNYLRKVMSL